MSERNSLKTVKVRLEACSFSADWRTNNPFISLSHRNSGDSTFEAVVGRATTMNVEAEPNGLLDEIGKGERFCCLMNLSRLNDGTIPNEIEISPYVSHPVPPEVTSVDCVACLPAAICIYTALHTMARIRKTESILIACPNDLNFTSIAMQICQNLSLRAFAMVLDDAALETVGQTTNPKNVFKLDSMDSDAMQRASDTFTGSLGFDCVVDFKNDSDPTGLHPLTFGKLVRTLAAFGRLVTDRTDPIPASETKVLHLKSCSVHFLFDQTWHLSPLHLGRYKHMVADIIDQLKDGRLRPTIALQVDSTDMDEVTAKHDEKLGCTVIRFPTHS